MKTSYLITIPFRIIATLFILIVSIMSIPNMFLNIFLREMEIIWRNK